MLRGRAALGMVVSSPYCALTIALIAFLASTVLTIAHVLSRSLPCFGSSGCQFATSSEFGSVQGIPISVFGVLASSVMVVVVFCYGVNGREGSKLFYGGLTVSTLGALLSLGLVAILVFELRESCVWCVVSATAWCLLASWFCYCAAGARLRRTPTRPLPSLGLIVLCIAGVGLVSVLATPNRVLRTHDPSALNRLSVDELLGMQGHTLGDPFASTVFIVFSDPFCSVCARDFEEITEAMDDTEDALFIYRHFPLTSNSRAKQAAAILEIANEKGRFWDVAHEVFRKRIWNLDGVIRVAESRGISRREIEARLQDPTDPIWVVVHSDSLVAKELELPGTPFCVRVNRNSGSKRVLGPGLAVKEIKAMSRDAET